MRHVYSVVRFVPDPAKGECVNLGLLAGSEDSEEWILQTVAQRGRARQLGGAGALPGVASYLERLAAELEMYSDAHASGQLALLVEREPFSEGWLANLASEQRGIVQFTAPQPVDVESAQAAVEMLWDQLIVEPSPRTYDFKNKHVALGAVREALRKVNITDDNLWRTVRLESGGFRAPIDFAVHDGRVAYLTQCWSFELPDKDRLLDEIQSWSWTMRSLRAWGGDLTIGPLARAKALDDVSYRAHRDVPRDVGLAVVYVPPANPEGEETFEKAERAFRDPDVNASLVVTSQEASEVAGKALAALGAVAN